MRKQSGIKGVVMGKEGDCILDRVTKEGFLRMVMSEQTPEIVEV